MNQVLLVGRLVFEPEVKQTSNGTPRLSSRIAVSRNDKEKTSDFINVQAWRATAEFIGKYFKKGDPIEIVGKLQTDSYEKKDGTKVTETYVLITEAGFVPGKANKTEESPKKVEDAPLPFEL